MARRAPAAAAMALLVAQRVSAGCLQSELLYGTTQWKSRYEHICCVVPQQYAEHAGFQQESGITFFDRLTKMEQAVKAGEPTTSSVVAQEAGAEKLAGVTIQKTDSGGYEFVFYDSQCGIPLFIAPRGRSFRDWRLESERHGWPSFREQEVVTKNTKLRDHGEVVSTCPSPTHLGHRFEDSQGGRYCIDLICIAGQSSNATLDPVGLVVAGHPKSVATSQRPGGLPAALAIVGIVGMWFAGRRRSPSSAEAALL
mmetsp:Transcript_105539/g.305266  ORF Transcript_105539/g.305266 Transcript_105539/m.305266 type:complete len:254 (+) Transcript_105539:45-806(+)